MSFSLKPISEQTIVITGGSSGIGLATAQVAAAQGARVLLAARGEHGLSTAVEEIRSRGGTAEYVMADVGERAQVEAIATAAIARFGGFDTWVNDAGVDIWGRLEHVSDEDHHRLFDTNFWGTVYGSLVAAAHLRNHGGAIINLGSIESDIAMPLQGMYGASKHAVKGFTDALRIEMEDAGLPVAVTLIKPSGIATPILEHTKTYTAEGPKLPGPLYAPEVVAEAILHAATHQERDITVGGAGRALALAKAHAPTAMDWVSKNFLMDAELDEHRVPNRTDRGLYKPAGDGRTRARHPARVFETSLYTRAAMHPLVTGAAVVAATVAISALLSRASRR